VLINQYFKKILLANFIFLTSANGQIKDEEKLCISFQTGNIISSNINEIKNNRDAQIILDNILNTIGVSKNFILAPCEKINNVIATAYKGSRYILYDRKFINEINAETNNWSSLFILAHEVGHHINGHSLDILLYSSKKIDPPTLKKKRKQELESDKFAAFVLSKMGANLKDLKEIINLVATDEDDSYSSHPNKSSRLSAIEEGFKNAKL